MRLEALVVAALLGAQFAAPAHADGPKRIVPGQAICVLARDGSLDEITQKYGATVTDRFVTRDGKEVYLLEFDATRHTAETVRSLRAEPSVAAAWTNRIVSSSVLDLGHHMPLNFPGSTASVPEPPEDRDPAPYDAQPFLADLRVADAQAISRGRGTVVAVIDTGVDSVGHPELAARMWTNPKERAGRPDADDDHNGLTDDVRGWDFRDGDADPAEAGSDRDFAFGHGTFIAGLVLKVAPEARVMALRAFGPEGMGTAWGVARAIVYAAAQGADVINMSFGVDVEAEPIELAIDDARERSVLVAAAGNNDGKPRFPAADGDVIAVAALNDKGGKASFSNFGSAVDLSAPGVHLVSTYPGGRYAEWSGTSFAAPIVSAAAALRIAKVRDDVFGVSREEWVADATKALEDTGVEIETRGVGRRVDITAALRAPVDAGDRADVGRHE